MRVRELDAWERGVRAAGEISEQTHKSKKNKQWKRGVVKRHATNSSAAPSRSGPVCSDVVKPVPEVTVTLGFVGGVGANTASSLSDT